MESSDLPVLSCYLKVAPRALNLSIPLDSPPSICAFPSLDQYSSASGPGGVPLALRKAVYSVPSIC